MPSIPYQLGSLSLVFLPSNLPLYQCAWYTAWQIEGEKAEVVTDFLFLGSKVTVDGDCSHEIRRHLLLGRKAMTNLDMCWKTETLYSADKGLYIQGHGLPSGCIQLWELAHKEKTKNWCLRTVVLEKSPESLLDSKEIKPLNLYTVNEPVNKQMKK